MQAGIRAGVQLDVRARERERLREVERPVVAREEQCALRQAAEGTREFVQIRLQIDPGGRVRAEDAALLHPGPAVVVAAVEGEGRTGKALVGREQRARLSRLRGAEAHRACVRQPSSVVRHDLHRAERNRRARLPGFTRGCEGRPGQARGREAHDRQSRGSGTDADEGTTRQLGRAGARVAAVRFPAVVHDYLPSEAGNPLGGRQRPRAAQGGTARQYQTVSTGFLSIQAPRRLGSALDECMTPVFRRLTPVSDTESS